MARLHGIGAGKSGCGSTEQGGQGRMKHWSISIALGGLGAIALLALAILTSLTSGFMWLSELAFYPGDHLYPWAGKSSLLGMGEGLHHQFVLLASLVVWWLVLALSIKFVSGAVALRSHR
jgi:hypothetical protein